MLDLQAHKSRLNTRLVRDLRVFVQPLCSEVRDGGRAVPLMQEVQRLPLSPHDRFSSHTCCRTQIDRFLANDRQRVFLLLGDTGAGKSMFMTYLATECLQRWRGNPHHARLPVPVALGMLHHPHHLLQEVLAQLSSYVGELAEGVRHVAEQPLLLLMDGFDELSKPDNLFTANKVSLSLCGDLGTSGRQHRASERERGRSRVGRSECRG